MRVNPPFVGARHRPPAQRRPPVCAALQTMPRGSPSAPLPAQIPHAPAVPEGLATAPGAPRPRAGGTGDSVKAQRAGERNMALGSSMCKIRKELQ